MPLPRLAVRRVCPHLTTRSLATASVLRVYKEADLVEPKETPTQGVAINTRIRKLNFPPFVKDLFCGVFNKSVLSYAEVLNYGRHYNLEQKVKDIGGYLEKKQEALAQVDRTGVLPPEVLHAFRQSGMFGLSVPTEHGGADFLATEVARILEVLGAEVSLAEFMNSNEALGGCQALLAHGTEEQKQKYLTQLSSGDLLGALCVAEEACGSDPASVAMTATLSEDGQTYLLNGTKTWVAGAGEAGLLTVLAKLTMRNYLGENDVMPTMFLVDRTSTTGIEVSEARPLAGLRGLQLRDVTFTDCRVPAVTGLLGGEGEGLAVLASIVHHNKFLMAAGLITHLRGLVDETIRWTNSRKQFGLNLSEFTLVRHQIAQMAARLYCLEAMVYLVAGLKDVAEVPDVEVESVLVKVYAAEASDFITRGCLNLLGMRACMEGSKFQRYLGDNQVVQQWQGGANILKCFVGVSGVIALAQAEENIGKIRQPVGGAANMTGYWSYQWDSRKHRNDTFPLKYKLNEAVHPRLLKSAEKVEWSAHKLHWTAKELLMRQGANMQVEEKYLERLSDIAMETFASVAALSRASRSYVVGHTHAEHEVNLAIPYIYESRLRVRENVWKCTDHDTDSGNRDEFWQGSGQYIAKQGSYCAVHPLEKNSF